MKRDMDLIRTIVLDVADATSELKPSIWEDSDAENTRKKVGYHIWLLCDGGYLNASFLTFDNDPYGLVSVGDLTWKGQDLADSFRPDNIWNEVKTKLERFGAPVAIGVAEALATELIRKHLGLPM